jgi:dTMP kinase
VAHGRLITVEGIDGAGKTTLARALLDAMKQRGVRARLLREPGGVELSERIRALLANPSLEMAAQTEALLYAAARAELVHTQVAPLLQAGTYVLLDRFVDSSLAYQGAGRSLGTEQTAAINAFATGGLVPDRTLLLRIAPRLARERLGARGGRAERLEGEQDAFFQRVARAYERLAESEPERVRAIEATLAPELVLELALAEIEDLLPPAGSARPR